MEAENESARGPGFGGGPLGSRVWGLGFEEFRDLGFRGLGFWGLGYRVWGLGSHFYILRNPPVGGPSW